MTASFKNYIAGDWIDGVSTVENRNPSDLTDLIGHFAQAGADQLEAAFYQAQVAQRAWEAYGIERKYNVLMGIGTKMMARAEELGILLAREEGKPKAEGKDGGIPRRPILYILRR